MSETAGIAYCRHGCGLGVDLSAYPDALAADGTYDCRNCMSWRIEGARKELGARILAYRGWANTGASPMTFAAVGALAIQHAEGIADAASALLDALAPRP